MCSLAAWVTSSVHLLGAQLVADAGEHQVDDLGDLLDRQRAEDHRRVDAVEELRPEVLLQLGGDLLLHQLVRASRARLASVVAASRKPSDEFVWSCLAPRFEVMMMIAVAEVDPATLGVGQVPVLEDLEEDVEDLRVRLLDLVEEDDAVVLAPDRLGQLAALVEADVAGGRPDERG